MTKVPSRATNTEWPSFRRGIMARDCNITQDLPPPSGIKSLPSIEEFIERWHRWLKVILKFVGPREYHRLLCLSLRSKSSFFGWGEHEPAYIHDVSPSPGLTLFG
ncbi:hypothetical protein PHYPSEUDO_015234 [Phytophthora pseudosyringae]|uniref:Uncharacterized protein n=1 Tax=Phytophthora pseudosyringae TaxID=221518 RepID=A0A8T1W0T2_9STRA|nr:hypothetical protein PHYPSEUDO_015234 [Phytophthora pseudosyringae]